MPLPDSTTPPDRAPTTSLRAAVRPRIADDAAALVTILAEVHAADRYPISGECVNREWLYDDEFEAAWVAELDGEIVGHLALRRGFGEPVVEGATGRPAAEILAVTRFFVGRRARGTGTAAALMDMADNYAVRHDLALALDVVAHNTSAIALYERRGWTRVGSYRAQWFGPDGAHPTAHYYVRSLRS